VLIATALVLLGLIFGITIASGPLGFVLLVALSALWAVVCVGFMQLIALKTRIAALRLTLRAHAPALVPRPIAQLVRWPVSQGNDR
jgi:hypothetical protein